MRKKHEKEAGMRKEKKRTAEMEKEMLTNEITDLRKQISRHGEDKHKEYGEEITTPKGKKNKELRDENDKLKANINHMKNEMAELVNRTKIEQNNGGSTQLR